VKLIDDRVKEAVAKGAKVHTGAKYDGQIYYPTILTNVPLDVQSPTRRRSDRLSWLKW
jgi:acyl-CoA reductase-like NAD-dependent aldehyde dehydrogenase